MNSKISIVIPVYNAENTIRIILDKLITQEYKNVEVVAVNDGSRDGSLSLLQTYAKKDKRIIIVDQENKGAGAARNVGMKVSSGDFITFIDSDDIIDDRLIAELASRVKSDIDFVMCGMRLNGKDIVAPDATIRGDSDIAQYVLKSLMTKNLLYGPCCKLFRRQLIVDNDIVFPTDIKYGEDTIFVLRYLALAKTMAIVGKSLYFYEISPSGLASKNDTVRIYRRFRTLALNEYMAGKWSASNILLYGILRTRWMIAYAKRRLL